MVVFIISYVFYFAWMGNRLFSGTIEGVQYFSGLNDSFFFMFVLLTTSNYPDIMLPSYQQERRFAIFYVTYLIIGLFLLMNLLLAIFYSNYQERVEASIDKFKEKRNVFLIKLFRQYDKKNEKKIDKEGVYEIAKELHSLVGNKDSVQEFDMSDLQFEHVFKLIDKDHSGYLDPIEMIDLFKVYETWLYEKQYASAMEDLYAEYKTPEKDE